MAIAVGSVFTLNALIPRIPSSGWKWLWMLQALTPLVTFNMLGSIEINVRPSSEDNIIVMSVLCSMVSVPALALVYVILIALEATECVFYVALVAKVLLWLLGHNLILKAQLDMRSKRGHSRIQDDYII